MAAIKCFIFHFVKRLALQNTKANCFAVIINGVMAVKLNSVVPFKTRFAQDKWHSALHRSVVPVSVSKTTSLFNPKHPANGFKHVSKFYLSQIISLRIKTVGN